MIRMGNVFILGDSYSTFEGWIPREYDCYYKCAGREETDVTKVEETWWHRLLSQTEARLIRNCSFSGSTICHTGYDGRDYIDVSFVTRVDRLIEQGFFDTHKIDTVFVFGGTNDSWADAPVGEVMYADWKKEDLYRVLPAFGYLVDRLREALPEAKVICIMNNEMKQEIEHGYSVICEHYQVPCLLLRDIDKQSDHPTTLGMRQIEEQVLGFLEANV